MKAVILAAGKGTRIRPLSEAVPKPMIPIISKPVMEFVVDLLRQHGFTEIMMSTAHLAHDIEHYFQDGSRFGVDIGYSFEGHYADGRVVPAGLGAAGGMKKIQEFSRFFDGTFAVVCGDVILDADLTRMVEFHREKRSIATMLLKDVPFEDVGRYGVVVTNQEGRITDFQEKPPPALAASTTVNAGVYLFEPEALDYIPPDQPYDIAWDFFPRLVRERAPFYGCPMPFTWIDVGRIPDYWRATRMLLNGELDFAHMTGHEIAPGIWGGINLSVDLDRVDIRGPVSIGSSTRIEPGATVIGPVVIGRNSVIESGARVESSVIADYTRVSGLAHLHERIVSGRFCVDCAGHPVDLATSGYAFVVDDVRERREWTDDQKTLIDFLRSHAIPA